MASDIRILIVLALALLGQQSYCENVYGHRPSRNDLHDHTRKTGHYSTSFMARYRDTEWAGKPGWNNNNGLHSSFSHALIGSTERGSMLSTRNWSLLGGKQQNSALSIVSFSGFGEMRIGSTRNVLGFAKIDSKSWFRQFSNFGTSMFILGAFSGLHSSFSHASIGAAQTGHMLSIRSWLTLSGTQQNSALSIASFSGFGVKRLCSTRDVLGNAKIDSKPWYGQFSNFGTSTSILGACRWRRPASFLCERSHGTACRATGCDHFDRAVALSRRYSYPTAMFRLSRIRSTMTGLSFLHCGTTISSHSFMRLGVRCQF